MGVVSLSSTEIVEMTRFKKTRSLWSGYPNARILSQFFLFYLSSLPVAHLSEAPEDGLVVTGDSARIQNETTYRSACFINVVGV